MSTKNASNAQPTLIDYCNAIAAFLNLKGLHPDIRLSIVHKAISDHSIPKRNFTDKRFWWSGEAATWARANINPYDIKLFRKNLTFEHVVPTNLAQHELCDLINPTSSDAEKVLLKAAVVCIVTKLENKRLHKNKMPEKWSFADGDTWLLYDKPKDFQTGGPIVRSQVSPFCQQSW